MDLRALPKVELHRHLEGAIRLATVFDLSREAGLPLPADLVKADVRGKYFGWIDQ